MRKIDTCAFLKISPNVCESETLHNNNKKGNNKKGGIGLVVRNVSPVTENMFLVNIYEKKAKVGGGKCRLQ